MVAIAYPSFTRADNSKAAVLPTGGDLSLDERKSVTIEIRARLRESGHRLARQKDVRQAASSVGKEEDYSKGQLTAIARAVQAAIVVAPMIRSSSTGPIQLTLRKLDVHTSDLVELTATIPTPGVEGLTRDQARPAVAACVAAAIGASPRPEYGPFPPVRRPGDNHPPAAAVKKDDKDGWGRWDHSGIFVDGGFVLAWCYGDSLCKNAELGFGGRLRVGFRMNSILAVSITGAVAAHEVPTSGEIEKLLSIERAFVWTGVYGGFRYHPIKKFPLDPFIGFDMGWTWFIYTESRDIGDLPIDEIPAEYLPSDISTYLRKRTSLVLDGFSVVPQAGLRFFFTPNIALGVSAEWVLTYWRSVCARVSEPTAEGMSNSGKKCAPTGNLEPLERIDPELKDSLTKRKGLPKIVTLEFELNCIF